MPFSGHVLAEESSIPALKHILNSKSRKRKALWLLAFLASFGLLIFHIVRLTQQYLQYDTSLQYRTILNDTFALPTIFLTFSDAE